jgi:hypothetical protein
MCKEIHRIVGDTLAEIDLVLWRFATLMPQWPIYLWKALEVRVRSALLVAILSRCSTRGHHLLTVV